MPEVLHLARVSRRFGAYEAVHALDLTVNAGDIVGVLGPNGAGKTTILRMVMGLLPPTAGALTLFETHAPGDPAALARIGYVPQRLAVYTSLTVAENVAFYARIYGVAPASLAAQVDRALNLVDLEAKRDALVSTLSGGQTRRVMLATALVHRPRLLILDEPTAGIDPALRLRFWRWFRELASEGVAIIITTHHIYEAIHCSHVVFLREGTLLAEGSPAALMERYAATDLEQAFVQATGSSG